MDTLKNMKFLRKLPTPEEIQQSIPLSKEGAAAKVRRDQEIADIFSGKDDLLGRPGGCRDRLYYQTDPCTGKGQG